MIGSYTVHLDDRRIEPEVHLTPIEWQLLDILAHNPGRLVSQRQLLQDVWAPTHLSSNRAGRSTF